MLHSNFKMQKGQMSLLALVITTVLLVFAMAHFHLLVSAIRGDQAHWLAAEKDVVLLNAVQQLRQTESPGSGETTLAEKNLVFEWFHATQNLIGVDQIRVDFPDQNWWPEPVGTWVSGPGFQVFIRDYRWE